MSELDDLVETSLNLGVMSLDDEGFKLDFLLRSSIAESKEALKEKLGTILANEGCKLALTGDYPGWAYNPNSVLTGRVADTYKRLFGKDAIVTGVHAGLECGILLEKKKDLDVISIGPNILNIHTPAEKLDLASVERVRELLIDVLSQKG
jgi:dipeptidase D